MGDKTKALNAQNFGQDDDPGKGLIHGCVCGAVVLIKTKDKIR